MKEIKVGRNLTTQMGAGSAGFDTVSGFLRCPPDFPLQIVGLFAQSILLV